MAFYGRLEANVCPFVKDVLSSRERAPSAHEIMVFRRRLLELRGRVLDIDSREGWRAILLQRIESMERELRSFGAFTCEPMWDALDRLALTFAAYNHKTSAATETMTNAYMSGGMLVHRFNLIYRRSLPGTVIYPFFLRNLFPNFTTGVARMIERRRDFEFPCSRTDVSNDRRLTEGPALAKLICTLYRWFRNDHETDITVLAEWERYSESISDEERAYDMSLTWIPMEMDRERINPATADWDEFLRAVRAIYSASVAADFIESEFEQLIIEPLGTIYRICHQESGCENELHEFTMWYLDSTQMSWWDEDVRRSVQRVLLGFDELGSHSNSNWSPLSQNCLVDVAHLLQYIDTFSGSYVWLDYISRSPLNHVRKRCRRSKPNPDRSIYGLTLTVVDHLVARSNLHNDLVDSRNQRSGDDVIMWFQPTGPDQFLVKDAIRRSALKLDEEWERKVYETVFASEPSTTLNELLQKRSLGGWITGTGATNADIPIVNGGDESVVTLPLMADGFRLEAIVYAAQVYDVFTSLRRPDKDRLHQYAPKLYSDTFGHTPAHIPLKATPNISSYILQTYGGLTAANDVLFSGKYMPNTAPLELALLDKLCQNGKFSGRNYAQEWDSLLTGVGKHNPYVRLSRLYYAYEERAAEFRRDTVEATERWYDDASLSNGVFVALANLEHVEVD